MNPQGTRMKGREMALVCHEKASRTALQTSSLSHTHTLFVQTHKHDVSTPVNPSKFIYNTALLVELPCL